MYKIIYNNKEVESYNTRREADYYKKKYPKSKVVTDYDICDLEMGMFADNSVIEAESPLKALLSYIKDKQLDIKVAVDNFNRGRFVVRSDHTSKVYEVITE